MQEIKKFKLPLTTEQIENLRAGDILELTGTIFTARDAAHQRLVQLIKDNKPLPIDINNATIYYVGPTPKKPNQVIGSAGPTSSYRMDPYTLPLLEKGLKIMIGKGPRSNTYKEELKKYKAIYASSIGGAAALISRTIKKCDLVCYEDLGPEAIYKLEVENFFCIVTYDTLGNDLYQEETNKYKNKQPL